MSTLLIVLLALIGAAALWLLTTYNKFVTLRARIKASIQEIGNQLKRQADLIPNLTSSVKGYLTHEKEIFAKLTDARKDVTSAVSKGDAQEMINASTKLERALAPIRVVVESTPQLASAGTVTKLMDELRDTADKVMYSRRTLIDLTADYNIMVDTVPSKFVADIFKFVHMPGLEVPEGAEEEISVKTEDMKNPEVKLD